MLVGHTTGHAIKDFLSTKLYLPIMIVRQEFSGNPLMGGFFRIGSFTDKWLLNKN